ncbi:unnamed protein product [Triticum turgidum subsp. durum]|uniref:Uncharacterized protein n=1 Tax=Triticum turgidum subsp. durum TaxID=4567 RepID=A0A9R0SG07_TRITD|nr:unnamed protein product [Triticum turgidum subsp. durum]
MSEWVTLLSDDVVICTYLSALKLHAIKQYNFSAELICRAWKFHGMTTRSQCRGSLELLHRSGSTSSLSPSPPTSDSQIPCRAAPARSVSPGVKCRAHELGDLVEAGSGLRGGGPRRRGGSSRAPALVHACSGEVRWMRWSVVHGAAALMYAWAQIWPGQFGSGGCSRTHGGLLRPSWAGDSRCGWLVVALVCSSKQLAAVAAAS